MATNPEVNIFLNGRDTGASKAVRGVQDSIESLAGSAVALQAGSILKDQFDSAIDAANKNQSALAGLASITSYVGVSQSAAKAAIKDFTADGLVGQTDAVTTLKNLLASGFSLPQAMQLMDAFKNKAAYNRQSWYDIGGAIAATSEGIKNGNSVLSDAAGTTTNLSVMAKQAGISIEDMGNVSQNSALRQAYLAGFTKDAAANMNDAATAASQYGGQQSQLNNIVFTTQARVGSLLEAGIGPLIGKTGDWIQHNQRAVTSLALAGGSVVAFGATIIGLASVVRFATLVMGGPLMLTLTLISSLAGVVAYGAFNKLQDQFFSTGEQAADSNDKIKKSSQDDMDAAGKAARKLQEQLSDLDKSVLRTQQDFQQSLAQLVKTHQNKINDLEGQIADEKTAFAKAQADKTDSFKQSQDDMAARHEDQVAQIQKDLNEENLKGRFADAGRIRDLQDRLGRENDEYSRSTAEKQATYQKDTMNAQTASTDRLTDLQTKLNEELAFMQKHAADLAGVRASDAMDELEQLQQSHARQMDDFRTQRDRIIENAKQTTDGSIAAQNAAAAGASTAAFSGLGGRMGKDMANALKGAFMESFTQLWQGWSNWVNALGSGVGNTVLFGGGVNNLLKKIGLPQIPGFADGGIVPAQPGGTLARVGEGGSDEAIIPLNNPSRANQIMRQAGLNGGGRQLTINQTNNYNVYGQMDLEAATRSAMWGLRLA